MKQNIKIPEGYKNSPLGVIPEEWEVKKLGEIGTFFKGKGVPKNKIINDGYKCLTYGDLYTKYDFIIKNVKSFINQKTSFISQKINFGDICFAGSGETSKDIGKCAAFIDDKNGYAGGDIIILRANENPITLSYILNSEYIIKQKSKYGQGHSVVHIYPTQLKKIRVALPPISEQQKIAEILTTWDEAIEKQTQLINLLEKRKHGLMQQLLTGKKRLKGFTEEWETVKLEKLFTERNEINNDNLPLLSITGEKGIIYQSDSEKRDISNGNKSKYKRICPNDIGYNTMRMWQGRSALSKFEGIVSPAYTVVSPKNNINVLFMSMLIKQPRVIYDFWTHSQGLVNDTLNCKFKDFKKVKVIIPIKEEQDSITEILTEANNEINLAKQKLESFRQQKKGLMQVLLTGKKRVKLN